MRSVDKCPGIQGSPQNLGSQGHQINENICLSLDIYVSHSPSYRRVWEYVCTWERKVGRVRMWSEQTRNWFYTGLNIGSVMQVVWLWIITSLYLESEYYNTYIEEAWTEACMSRLKRLPFVELTGNFWKKQALHTSYFCGNGSSRCSITTLLLLLLQQEAQYLIPGRHSVMFVEWITKKYLDRKHTLVLTFCTTCNTFYSLTLMNTK